MSWNADLVNHWHVVAVFLVTKADLPIPLVANIVYSYLTGYTAPAKQPISSLCPRSFIILAESTVAKVLPWSSHWEIGDKVIGWCAASQHWIPATITHIDADATAGDSSKTALTLYTERGLDPTLAKCHSFRVSMDRVAFVLP